MNAERTAITFKIGLDDDDKVISATFNVTPNRPEPEAAPPSNSPPPEGDEA